MEHLRRYSNWATGWRSEQLLRDSHPHEEQISQHSSHRRLASTGIASSLMATLKIHPVYRVIQEEMSIFWEVIVSVVMKNKFVRTCVWF
jgi:hypothetical protein